MKVETQSKLKVINELPTESEMFSQIMVTVEASWQNRLSHTQIEQWLSNFKGEVFDVAYERQLALWLLCNFVYYNDREVRHLCRTAFREFLHFTLNSLPFENSRDWGKQLTEC